MTEAVTLRAQAEALLESLIGQDPQAFLQPGAVTYTVTSDELWTFVQRVLAGGVLRPPSELSLADKQASNTWDHLSDFHQVYRQMLAGQWWWFNNSACKYVELRVDMRDGGCLIKNRHGERIDPTELARQ